MHVCAQLCQTVAFEAPLPMKFFQQEYWSGLPFPLPLPFLHIPDPWIEPASSVSCVGGRFFTTEVFVNVFESMNKGIPLFFFFNLNYFKPIER